jgi:hypothetical protein
MSSEIAGNINELISVQKELRSLQRKAADLKTTLKELKEKIRKYIIDHELEVLEYGNLEITLSKKPKRKAKKRDEKIIASIEVLNKYGISESNAKELIGELTEATRGDKHLVDELRIENPTITI